MIPLPHRQIDRLSEKKPIAQQCISAHRARETDSDHNPMRESVSIVTVQLLWRPQGCGYHFMPKLDDQISTLQQRLQQLKLRQQHIDARKRAITANRERKTETRRRILVGALVLEKVQQGEMDKNQLLAWLDEALTRTSDRVLFDLPSVSPDAGAVAETRSTTDV
jgi:large subunit ribosomal protein L7/L12